MDYNVKILFDRLHKASATKEGIVEIEYYSQICQVFLEKVTLAKLYPTISLVKADNGYRGTLKTAINQSVNIELRCVKSNFGTSDFVPLGGRWVVERSFSWLENYRRLCRNYERFLSTALAMCQIACLAILIKHL